MVYDRFLSLSRSRFEALPETWRFLSAGGSAAFVNISSRYLLTPVMGFDLSVVIAYLIGMAVAYVLFRTVVFERSGRSIIDEGRRFVLVNILGFMLVWSMSVTLAHHLFPALGLTWHADDVAHVISVCLPALSSFIGHKYYSYAKPS